MHAPRPIPSRLLDAGRTHGPAFAVQLTRAAFEAGLLDPLELTEILLALRAGRPDRLGDGALAPASLPPTAARAA